MGKHGNKKHNSILTNMSSFERGNQLSKTDKTINSTLERNLSKKI